MVNSQNIAILSEKVAALEAAIKNAGIELPEVSSSDNGKALQVVNGAWATGDVVSKVIANPEGEVTSELSGLGVNGINYSVAPNRLKTFTIEGDYVFNNAQVIEVGNLSTLTGELITKDNLKGACVIGTASALFVSLASDETTLRLVTTTTITLTIHARIVLFY